MKGYWKVFLLSFVLFGGAWLLREQPATFEDALVQVAFIFVVVVVALLILPILLWTIYLGRPRMDDKRADKIAEDAMRERLGMK